MWVEFDLLAMYRDRHLLNKSDELYVILTCRQSKVQMAHLNVHICHLNLVGPITALYRNIVKRNQMIFDEK
jgi:hypothetical protein